LETENNVSQLAVAKIAREILEFGTKVHKEFEAQMLNLIQQMDLSPRQDELLREKLAMSPFEDLQDHFRSYYMIEKVLKESPTVKYQEPKQIQLGDNKKVTFQYISVVDTISTIVADPGFKRENPSEDGLLRGVRDGTIYKENEFFLQNPEALTIELYSDAFEITNPLGASRGIHKIVNVYFSLAELPKGINSKIENKFLVLSAKNAHMKTYKEDIYKPLIADLKRLESGVLVNGEIIKAGLLSHVGDNLEIHSVVGLSQCFSSGYICRLCEIRHEDLESCRGIPEAKFRTQEQYDAICDRIEAGEQTGLKRKRGEIDENLGIKDRCIFNCLDAFKNIEQTPFDMMHDFLERIVSSDCQSILIGLSNSGVISLRAYNEALSNMKFEDYESGDRPFLVKEGEKKLTGKAMSLALHVRVMPIVLHLIADIDEDCELFQLLCNIHNILEILMAHTLAPEDAFLLQNLVIEFFRLRRACAEKLPSTFCKLVPKHHYLEHYAQQVMKFGPFTASWTAR
jgi:hypothetical protein